MILRLLIVLSLSLTVTGIVLFLQAVNLARPGFAPAVFVTVLLLGLALSSMYPGKAR